MIDGHPSPCDEGIIETAAATPCARDNRPWVLMATILGSSLAFITGSVVNVALPAIQAAFGATAAQMQWVINSYLLFLSALILVGGAAGDRFGRRRVFVIGTAVFTGASVWGGLAGSVTELIIARGVQGLGGALLVPGSLAIISAAFPEDERGPAIGTWAGFSALTTAFGPVLGGWLIDAFSWRGVFFVVVPFALGCIAVTWWRVPESRDERAAALDGVGAAFATGGLGALVYGLGMAISVAPLTTVVMNAASERHAGAAFGINNAAARLAGLLAIAVLGVVATELFAATLADQLARVDAPPAAEQTVWAARHDLAGAAVPPGIDAGAQQTLRTAIDTAFVRSFRWVMALAAGLALASAVCAALTIPARAVDESEADALDA